MKTNIYAIQDITGNVRYIGKTSKSIEERFSVHLSHAKRGTKNHVYNWIRSCMKQGYLPLIKIIDGPIDGDGSLEEMYWIARFKREGCNLTNQTLGGEGNPGYIPSEEARLKMINSHLGVKLGPHSEEHKRKISESNKGLKRSLETRLRVSQAQIGKKLSQEQKDKISKLNKGRIVSDSVKMKISIANIGKKRTEETKRKLSISHKGFIPTLDTRKKLSEASKLVWNKRKQQKIMEA